MSDSQKTNHDNTEFVLQPRNLCGIHHGDKSSLCVARVDDGGQPYNDDDGTHCVKHHTEDIIFACDVSVYRICYGATSNKEAAMQCICDSVPRIRVSKS